MTCFLVNRNGEIVATLPDCRLDEKHGRYLGFIESESFSPEARQALRDLDEIVNDMTFSLVDQAQAKVDGLELGVRFETETASPILDLFVSHEDGGVCFRLSASPVGS